MKTYGLILVLCFAACGGRGEPARVADPNSPIAVNANSNASGGRNVFKRLPPSAFPQLPAAFAKELEGRACSIPQTMLDAEPHNVISGEFAKKGQKDWAAICYREGKSAIHVFWGGPAKCPADLPRGREEFRTNDEPVEYPFAIKAVGRDFILEHYRGYGGPRPPPIDHHGIDDIFVEKASSVWYCHGGKWLRLQGAD